MRRYLYEEIAEQLKALIGPGKEFGPGVKLPSRRELMERFGRTRPGGKVSSIVIDKAIRILRWQGYTETLPGVGVYVVEDHPDWRQEEEADPGSASRP